MAHTCNPHTWGVCAWGSEVQVIFGSIVNLRSAWDTWDPVSKNQNQTKQKQPKRKRKKETNLPPRFGEINQDFMKFTDTVDQNFREGLPIRVASLHSKMPGAVLWPWLSTRTLGHWGKYSHHRTGALRVRPPPPQLLVWTQFHDCSAGKWTKSRAKSCWTEGAKSRV